MTVFKIGEKKVVQAFISVPMSGRSDDDIREIIKVASENVKRILKGRGVDMVRIYSNLNCPGPDSYSAYDPENGGNIRLHYLGEAVKTLGTCSVCYFCSGWKKAHGCRIEHAVCEEYDIERIYECDEQISTSSKTCDEDLALLQHDWV